MADTSQTAVRVIALVVTTALFAGAWANDRPLESMAQRELPRSSTIMSHEDSALESQWIPECPVDDELSLDLAPVEQELQPESLAAGPVEAREAHAEPTATPASTPSEIRLVAEEQPTANSAVITAEATKPQPIRSIHQLKLALETEGLTISRKVIEQHVRQLPLSIGNGDYLMVDAAGGVGWLRIRGQLNRDGEAVLLTTKQGEESLQFIRVTPINAQNLSDISHPTQLARDDADQPIIR